MGGGAMEWGALAIIAAAVTSGCQSRAPVAPPPPTPPAKAALPLALPDDGMVDVGNGTSLHVHCAGQGSPPVVLDECAGCDAGSWHLIQPRVAGFTRACAYDRAGVGYSSPARRPHLARQLVQELRALLGNRDDAGPIVLVGQGAGGYLAQDYARTFPRSIVGMVLVDTATMDYDSRYYALFPPEAFAKLKGEPAPPEYLDPEDQARARAEMRAAPLSLGDRPLVAINHGKPWAAPLYGISPDAWAKLETAWFAMEADVARLSDNSEHVVATEAEWIPEEAPDRVVTGVWNVVSSARSGIPLSHLPATAPPAPLPAAIAATAAPRAAPVDDGMVDIGGGMSLHLHCIGHGSPTVVMDNGLGANGGSWGKVMGDIGAVTRTCVYDRAGIGLSSSPAPRPHPLRQMAHELQTLLDRAGVAGPYVLVAHSLAGLNDRLFQAEHPDEVVGMVLVDVTSETVPPLVGDVDKGRAHMRDNVEGVDYDTLQAGLADVRASARSLGDMPLVVLSAGGRQPHPPDVSPEKIAEMHRLHLDAHEQMAHLSTNSAHVVAERAGHFVQLDSPLLVIASVKQVVEAVRTHGRVDANALAPLKHDGPREPR